MTQPNAPKIEERLTSDPVEAPRGLAERIKSEIPERPRVIAWPSSSGEGGSSRTRRWAIAATVAVALIGTGLTVRLSRQVATPTIDPAKRQTRQTAEPPEAVATIEPTESVLGEMQLSGTERDDADQSTELREPFDQPRQPAPPTTAGEEAARELPPTVPHPRAMAVPKPSPEMQTRVEQLRLPENKLQSLSGRQSLSMADGASRPASRGLFYPQGPPPEPRRPGFPPSTGGTTEPNDQPYGDMFFKSWGVNPFIDTEDDHLSTFGLDVDSGSYTVARSYIERGHLPPSEAIRVEEFINYFDYGDAVPERGDFAIHAESAPSPFASGPRYQLLRFNLRAREIEAADRQPATLIFVVDVSGSMSRDDRLTLVKRSLSLLLDQLRPDDRVGLVIYGSVGRVLLEPTGDLEAIRTAIDRLQAEGSTNAEEGLLLAYELAERYRRPGAIQRVILCSDGVANVGRTGPESILRRIKVATEQGIELTAVGFGMGNYNDLLMEQLADHGDGSYAYVDTLDEARRVFVENLTGTLQTIAAEAKAQVEFNPAVVARYRLLGYENRDIADERFRDDTVDAGEIGAGHSVTALYEIKLHPKVRRNAVLATLHLRYESKAAGEIVEVARSIRVRDAARGWDEASAALRLTSLVAEYAEILRDSYWAKDGDLQDVFARAQRVSADFAGDVEVASFVSLVGRAARLESGASGE